MCSHERSQSLSDRINESTRSKHTQLNRLIIARLPLALPPYTNNQALWTTGLSHIARIYITFESLWQQIISSSDNSANKILSDLFLPELHRSERLRLDVCSLTGKSLQEVDEILSDHSENDSALSRFIQHIQSSVARRPHVLVAYSWVMWMALFSGGRIIRATLYNVGPGFWCPSPGSSPSAEEQDAQPEDVTKPILDEKNNPSSKWRLPIADGVATTPAEVPIQSFHRFFYFPGYEDGEDLKREFKRRFSGLETRLTHAEKMEIVAAAQQIFHFMIEIVGELDAMCNTNLGPREDTQEDNGGNAVGQTHSVTSASVREWNPRVLFRRGEAAQPVALLTFPRALDVAMVLWICLTLVYLTRR